MKKITFLWATACVCASLNAQPNMNDTSFIQLNEIVINASIAGNDAPLTLNTIPRKEITLYGNNGTYPEILRNIGGVYATSDAGNYGDAKINIRGFKQDNISVMLNGLPLSGVRSGSLFWNNWLGLTEATQTIQVQKGVGQSMLSGNALGGSINIITRPAGQPRSGSVAFNLTDYGQYKLNLSLASGELKNGWAFAFVGSHTWGDGYVDMTSVNSWSYFLTASKYFNPQHTLVLNIMGSPERHEQRNQKLSNAEVAAYGLRYNKNWGYDKGEAKTINANKYHKPYITLDWYFTPSINLNIATTAYFTIGDGGGLWTEWAKTSGRSIINHRTAGGQIDWNSVRVDNVTAGQSLNILSDYLAGNTSAGLKSTANRTLNDEWDWLSGFHYQYFYSWQHEQITDLLGGDHWYENYAQNSLAGLAGRDPIKRVGDYVRLNNGSKDHSLSLFTQVTHRSERLNAFAGGLLMANFYQRWDKYNYIDNTNSEVATGIGGNIKAGITYKLSPAHQLYLNGGVYSRVPYSGSYFSQNNNNITSNVGNEWNFMGEAGYKFESEKAQLNLNGYYAYWKNRTLLSNPYRALDEQEIRYMIKGLDAQHLGVELNYDQQIATWLGVSAFGSLGYWQWKNDVNATVYDPYSGQPVETIQVYADGLFVGDAPQTQFGAAANLRFFNTLECRFEYRYNARMYANFDPAGRTNPDDRAQPYRLPEAHIASLFINYSFKLGPVTPQLFFSCNNLFDSHHIERGDDGAAHDLNTFRGFWGYGRTMQAGIRVGF